MIESTVADMMPSGSKVRVHYTARLDDGEVVESTYVSGGIPAEMVIGSGSVPAGLECAIASMSVGERKTVRVPPSQAYGEYDEHAKETVPVELFSHANRLSVGEVITVPTPIGNARLRVESMNDKAIVLDCNHELAGNYITYEIELLRVLSPDSSALEEERFYAQHECGCCSTLKAQAKRSCTCA